MERSTADGVEGKPGPGLPARLGYAGPNFSLAVAGTVFGGWLTFLYLPPADEGRPALVSAGVLAAAMLIGRIVDAIADPLIGHWSDRCTSRLGRRRPFLLYGTPLMALTYLAIWSPPFGPGSLGNDLYLVLSLCLYWIMFTVVVAPWIAMLPEIARTSSQRVFLSSLMAVFNVLGLAAGFVLPGLAQTQFPNGAEVLGVHFDTGIQLVAVSAGMLLMLFWLPVLFIRERPGAAEQSAHGLLQSLKQAFGNPAFRTYVAMVCLNQMGLTLLIAIMPYLTTQIMEGPGRLVAPGTGETWAGILQAGVVVLAALGFPLVNRLVSRVGKKRLYLIAGAALGGLLFLLPLTTLLPDPAWAILPLFALVAAPVSVGLVLPNAVYADVVDVDEERSGLRREGLYTGSSALLSKAAVGLAQALTVLLVSLGASSTNPIGILLAGPLAGALILGGTRAFRRHPVEA